MIGLNAGLEIARKALSAYQLSLGVYGNNIANVNTPGYSRRIPTLKESDPAVMSFGRMGLGVDVASISRMRDKLLDVAYRKENSSLGRYDSMEQALSGVETVLSEPSDSNLNSAISEFWNSWQELANQPESSTARTLVTDTASSLCTALQQASSQLANQRDDLDQEIRGCVDQVNSIASQIATLNGEIIQTETSGAEASDLRDQRDSLLDQLSNIATISVSESKDGSASVFIGSEALVERSTAVPLEMVRRPDRGASVTDIKLAATAEARTLAPSGGKLAGLIESRDSILPRYMSQLDEMAKAIVEGVNRVHSQGYDLSGAQGGDFFDPAGTTASTIRVSDAVLGNADLIAASSDGTPGSGDNALAISDLSSQGMVGDEKATVDEYYSTMVGSLGVESSSASSEEKTESLLVDQIDARRESVKGVSIDDETTNLIATQHAYQAAAKVVSVIDQMMTSLLSTT